MTPLSCFGGRNDRFANLNGMLSDIAVFRRALSASEIEGVQRAVTAAAAATATAHSGAAQVKIAPE